MWDWIKGMVWSALKALAKLALDVFLAFWQWVYDFLNESWDYVVEKVGDGIVELITELGKLLPSDSIDNILKTYQWLEYIDSWVPLKFGIGLLVTYYSMALIKKVGKYFLSIVFGSHNPA